MKVGERVHFKPVSYLLSQMPVTTGSKMSMNDVSKSIAFKS